MKTRNYSDFTSRLGALIGIDYPTATAQEQAFMDAGWGVDRRLVAHNYFWIVGPASDPAAISGMTS